MPVFEYYCSSCNAKFEELLSKKEDIAKYKEQYPCDCGNQAKRLVSSATPIFKGVQGKSGFYDIDNPILDKAVGRSSDKKWTEFNIVKEKRDKIRKEHGVVALTVDGDKVVPTSKEKLETREKALKAFKKATEDHEKNKFR